MKMYLVKCLMIITSETNGHCGSVLVPDKNTFKSVTELLKSDRIA